MPSFERGAYEPSDDVRVFDGAVDDEQDEEGSRLPLLIVIGLLVFAMFAGVVWLAYTQGVAKGRSDAPRMIVADTGPVKTAPTNPGGTQTPYTGLKIYQSPAPADDSNDEAVIQLLRKEGVFRKGIRRSSIQIEWEDSGWFISDARNGKPEFRLQRVIS